MSHYLDWIKLYRRPTGFRTGIREKMHIIWIKDFIKWRNMRTSDKKQTLDHNIEKFSLMIRADLDMFSSAEIFI